MNKENEKGLVLNLSEDDDVEDSEGTPIIVKPEVLDDIAERIETRVVMAMESRHHSGPLPPPELLEAYNQVMPGLGAIIVQQMQDANLRANKEQDHRHSMQARSISISENFSRAEIKTTRIGQIAAILLVILLLAIAVFLIVNKYSTEGFTTLAVTMAGIIASQVLHKRAVGSNKADKNSAIEPSEK